MVKALLFDLDGTIVSPKTGTYSAAIAETFSTLSKLGIILIAATGRSPYELQYTRMIDGLPFDAVVSLNGQYCFTESEDLYINPFPANQGETLLNQINQAGFPCAVIQRDKTFINFANPFVEEAQKEIKMPVPEFCDLELFFGKEILMLTVFAPEQDEEALLKLNPDVIATRWNPYAFDLVPTGSGKCHGIEVVFRHFGINWNEVFAFGDGNNDYEMLKRSGKGFAMRNSNKRLLNGDFEVTDTVDNDGVVKILQKYSIL